MNNKTNNLRPVAERLRGMAREVADEGNVGWPQLEKLLYEAAALLDAPAVEHLTEKDYCPACRRNYAAPVLSDTV